MSHPVYTFDHGLTLPIRTALYNAIEVAVADLLQGMPPVTETVYGPVFRDIRPLPISLQMLYDIKEERFVKLWVPKEGPALAVWIRSQTMTLDQRGTERVEGEYQLEIYFSTACNNVAVDGVLFQEVQQLNRMKDPGLNVLEDLLVSRLHNVGLVLSAENTSTLTVDEVDDIGFLVDQLWRRVSATAKVGYAICQSRDAVIIDGAKALHTVPDDAGEPIHEQAVDF